MKYKVYINNMFFKEHDSFMWLYAQVWLHFVRQNFDWDKVHEYHTITFKKKHGRGYKHFKTIPDNNDQD